MLQGIAEREQKRHGEQRGEEGIDAEALRRHQHHESCQHDEVAVSEIDQTHDAEDQGQAGLRRVRDSPPSITP